MAQIKIRKYNPGGVLTTETGDTFTLEEIEQLVRENPTNENLKDIANELRAGKNVQHSISDNWSSVTDDDFGAGQKRRIAKNPNSFGRRLAATFNTQVHQYGEDVNDTTALLSAARKNASTNNEGAAAGSASVSDDEYTLISSGGGSRFVYDDNGAYVNGDFTNAKLMSLLRDLNNYFADDNGGASYKFKGISADVRKTLKEMYDANPNLFNDLMNKVQSGRIIEGSPEASLLMSIGIGSNTTKAELEQAAKDKALKDYFVGKGFTEDQYKELLPFVELDGQGLRLKDGVEGSPFIAGQNYYFNDDYNGAFKDLVKGQILFNNRFYDANQLAGSGMITDWVKALREHRFADADAMIKWDWKGVGNNYDYQLFDNQKYYNDFLDGKRYLDVTGQYEKTYDDQGNEYQIMGYYDPNDVGNYTSLGFVDPSKIKYARFDSTGKLIDENYNTAFLRRAANPWQHTSIFQERRDDGQVVIPSIVTRNGRGILGMDVTFDPDKGTVQFHGSAVQNVLGAENGDTIELDGEIAQILSPEFFANLEHSNKKDLSRFKDTILSLVGTDTGNNIMRNQLSRGEWEDLLRPTYGDQAGYYANILFQYFKQYIGATSGFRKLVRSAFVPGGPFVNYNSPSRQSRIHEFTPKHQHGGLFTGSAAAASSAPRIVQSDKYIPATTEEAGAFEFGQFTNADWAELAGLGADLASVVTGVSGASIPSAVLGFAGTASSFGADISRDGFQMKDLGNLGLGLLFDVGSLIPFIGTASASAGVVNKLRKGLPVLLKLAGIAGIGSSLSLAVNKIQSGEKLTMKDLRVIMNGVLGTYTLAKQGIDPTNSRARDGAELDVDIQKMHMDDIDASNLSDGQKAAMKQFFDPDPNTKVGNRYRDSLDVEQQKIFDQFIADGGDETALKMMIGDNDLFKTLRSDRALLEKVKQSLKPGGEKLTSEELRRYNELIQESGLRARLGTDEYLAKRNLDQSNADLANALKTLEDPNISKTDPKYIAAESLVSDYRVNRKAEYGDFFAEWDKLPSRSRYEVLDDMLKGTTAGSKYHAGMFSKKNSTFGKDADWAAEVKNREKAADDLLAKHNEIVTAINEKQKKIDELEALTRRSKKQEADLATLQSEQTALFDEQLKLSDGSTGLLHDNGDLEFDSVSNTWRKKLALRRDVQTVKDQFNPTGEKTRQELQDEFDVLDKDSSEAMRLADRQTKGSKLIDDYLSDSGSKKISKTFDVTVEQEFKNLTPEERAEVLEILNKPLDGDGKISEEDLDVLNFYTLKNDNKISGDVTKIRNKRTKAVQKDASSETLQLNKDLGLDEVSVLMRQSGVPSKIKLSETDWAKIKRSAKPKEALIEALRKNNVDEKVIDKVVKKVTTEVEKPAESEGRNWLGRKKKKASTSTTSTPTEPDFEINDEFFKTLYKDDNTLKGRILGRTTAQRKYMERLTGESRADNVTSKTPRIIQKSMSRYYQPMIHGLHYNLMRDPIHHTPWYEPKEITIQLENEEE